MLDADEIVKTYRAQQARLEDQLVEDMVEGRKVDFEDISHLASDDLARFIVQRAVVIDSLAKMPRESAEHVLHDAILKKTALSASAGRGSSICSPTAPTIDARSWIRRRSRTS